jgi:hypothetical protein
MLQEQDFVLHYLSPLTSGLQLRRKELSEAIYGYDRSTLFSVKSLNSRAEVGWCMFAFLNINFTLLYVELDL